MRAVTNRSRALKSTLASVGPTKFSNFLLRLRFLVGATTSLIPTPLSYICYIIANSGFIVK